MIQNVIFRILFLKILFQAYNFFIFAQMFQRTSSEFLYISDLLAESFKSNKNQRKRSFIVQCSFARKTSLILRTSTHLTLKIYALAIQPKTFLTLKSFQQTCFCLVSEKTFALNHFLTPKNCIFEILRKQISVYFCISP